MNAAFRLYEEATPELIEFLSKTILGTNGAKYQHLDTEKRIAELENPLHLSLFRNEKIIGNISFCRRGKEWYIRYFAFDIIFQGTGQVKKTNSNSVLKKEIIQFFKNKIDTGEVDRFYAYIDPNNSKSSFLAKQIGFQKSGMLHTQTFSRLKPQLQENLLLIEDETLITHLIEKNFSSESFYHQQLQRGRFYALYDNQGEIIAFAAARKYNWKIHQLPGKNGKLLTHLIPFIPIIRQFIRPKLHSFIGIDNLWSGYDGEVNLNNLLEGVLEKENQKMLIWWTDSRIEKYTLTNWGITNKLFHSNNVHLYSFPETLNQLSTNFYVASKDLT